jgi:hypothetical protein
MPAARSDVHPPRGVGAERALGRAQLQTRYELTTSETELADESGIQILQIDCTIPEPGFVAASQGDGRSCRYAPSIFFEARAKEKSATF